MNSRQKRKRNHERLKSIKPILNCVGGKALANSFESRYGTLKGFSKEDLQRLIDIGVLDCSEVVYSDGSKGIQESWVWIKK